MQRKNPFGRINHLHVATGGSIIILVLGLLSFSGSINLVASNNGHNNNNPYVPMTDHFHVLAQPASDFPVPDSNRMFTNDTARIQRFNADPYILDTVQTPKQVEAGKPALFIFNLFDKSTMTWLWHSDMRFQITDSKGHSEVVLPNLHGHGSVIEIEYTFPTPGKYTIDLIIGQQTGSPNFMIEPKVIREVKFDVDVRQATSSPSSGAPVLQSGKVRDVPVKVESWKFTQILSK